MLQFKKIDINDFEIYKKYSDDTNEFSCENSFVNLLVWQSAYNNMLAICDDLMIIKSNDDNIETFRLPLGDNFERGIELIKEYCGERTPEFWTQQGDLLEQFKSTLQNEYVFEENRDAFDYIYLQSDLAELGGKKYHSKRNHINTFSKKFNWRYEKINENNLQKVKDCANKWYLENIDRVDSYMQCEKRGVFTILNNMQTLGVKGGAIIVKDEVVAFTLGSPINSNVFDIHVEKALKDYSEAYTVINNQFAKNELSDYKYINREDDMGLEGLRKAKLSYKPHILLKKYHCYKKHDTENKNG